MTTATDGKPPIRGRSKIKKKSLFFWFLPHPRAVLTSRFDSDPTRAKNDGPRSVDELTSVGIARFDDNRTAVVASDRVVDALHFSAYAAAPRAVVPPAGRFRVRVTTSKGDDFAANGVERSVPACVKVDNRSIYEAWCPLGAFGSLVCMRALTGRGADDECG